ncbi:hypothetical protein AAVH_33512 [Aphelenchoides avenae]|nr:hypothetical protein AAVH_33512 [Aphelenchus avenae]
MNLLVHTLSSFGSDDFIDDYAPSDISVSVVGGPKQALSRQESVDNDHVVPPELDEKGEFPRLIGHENQMHEQSLIVTDLIASKASEFKIERMLKLLRFKQFPEDDAR